MTFVAENFEKDELTNFGHTFDNRSMLNIDIHTLTKMIQSKKEQEEKIK